MPPRFDPSKPLAQIKAIAAAWGWWGLEMWQQSFDDDGKMFLVTWYSTSDPKFYLQINEHPIGNVEAYAASVYAKRHGIHTGWHRFELDDDGAVKSLAAWLSRRQFKDRKWRRGFRSRHSECCVERLPRRGRWEPYLPDDSKPPA